MTFKIEIDAKALTYLKEKSTYNRNFWRINILKMGDYLGQCEFNILREEFDEFTETAYFSIGKFENDKFMPMFTWLEENPPLMPYSTKGE
jgi:hypothetical protein